MLARCFALSVAVVVLVASRSASAQISDSLASISYEHYPFSVAPRDPTAQVGLRVFRFRAGFPVIRTKKTILIPGLSYERLAFDTRGASQRTLGPLHAPSASLTLVQRFGDRVLAIGAIGAGLASDFEEPVTADDVLFTATALVLYKFTDTFSLGAGATYDRRTGSLTPIPAVAVNWQIGDKLRLRGFVPALLNAEYRALPWLTVGIRATLEGNRFHLSPDKFGAEKIQLAYSTLTVGPKVTFRLMDMLHLDVYASTAVMRRYEAFIDGNSAGSAYLAPVVLFGARVWFGPAGWRGDPALGR